MKPTKDMPVQDTPVPDVPQRLCLCIGLIVICIIVAIIMLKQESIPVVLALIAMLTTLIGGLPALKGLRDILR